MSYRALPLVLFTLSFGCGTPAVCAIGAETVAPGLSIDSLERDVFERLLLARGTDADDGELACNRSSTRFPDMPERCMEREAVGDELAPEPPGPEDLVVEPAEGDFWLAYLPVRRFSNGMSEGPVAIVRRDGSDVEVRALGVLRVLRGRIGLRLERVGEHVVLFADGEHCQAEEDCTRSTRLLLLVGQRLEPLHVAGEDLECMGPAVFVRQESRTVRISERTEHVLTRTLGLDIEGASLRVAEDIVVHERAEGVAQTRVVRRTDAAMSFAVDAPHMRLIASGTSRWSSLLLDASSLATSSR